MQLFRIMYSLPGRDEWFEHVGNKGTQFYTTLPGARSAMTQFHKRNRRYGGEPTRYKVQVAEIPEWRDAEDA